MLKVQSVTKGRDDAASKQERLCSADVACNDFALRGHMKTMLRLYRQQTTRWLRHRLRPRLTGSAWFRASFGLSDDGFAIRSFAAQRALQCSHINWCLPPEEQRRQLKEDCLRPLRRQSANIEDVCQQILLRLVLICNLNNPTTKAAAELSQALIQISRSKRTGKLRSKSSERCNTSKMRICPRRLRTTTFGLLHKADVACLPSSHKLPKLL